MSSSLAAAIFWRCSISSTVVSRSRREAASSKRISSEAAGHAGPQFARQVGVAAFEKQADIAHRGGVGFVGGEAFHARSQAAVNVILQARLGMEAGEVHLARRHQEVSMDEVHQAMRQVGGKVGAEVGGAILAQAPRHVNARVFFVRELDVGVGFVVAQQDIKARLVLLDEVVFERQRLFFVVDQDVVDVAGFGDQGAGFDVGQLVFEESSCGRGGAGFWPCRRRSRARRRLCTGTLPARAEVALPFRGVPSQEGYNLIMSRWIPGLLLCALMPLAAQEQTATPNSPSKPQLEERTPPKTSGKQAMPPEEDKSFLSEEHSFNPLQSQKSIEAGDTYWHLGKIQGALYRYKDATLWNDGNAQAWLKLGKAEEKIRDKPAAKEAYQKYLSRPPRARNPPPSGRNWQP